MGGGSSCVVLSMVPPADEEVEQIEHRISNTEVQEFSSNDKVEHSWYLKFVDGIHRWKFINGDIYVGAWQNGRMHGKGTLASKRNEVYDGEFVNNEYHGEGVYVYNNGDIYEGLWEAGRRHGRGMMTYANETRINGVWEHGEMQTADMRKGFCSLYSYEGEVDVRDLETKPGISENSKQTSRSNSSKSSTFFNKYKETGEQ
jgi:hypothetical protein